MQAVKDGQVLPPLIITMLRNVCGPANVAARKATSLLSSNPAVNKAVSVARLPMPSPVLNSALEATRHFGAGMEMRHQNTDVNHTRLPWDFTLESYEKIEKIMSAFPRSRRRSGVIPLLHLAQVQHGGWIPVTAMYKIARICEVPPMTVFEVVTFYAMFNRKPVGKYHLQFCVTTPCMLRGCDDLIHQTERYLGVKLFGTTPDGLFTVGEMECMGCCVNAPMVVVSDYSNPPNFRYDFYEDLDWNSMKTLLEDLRAGRPTRVGTQLKDRKWSEPQGGRTTLFMKTPPGPFCRDLTPPPPPPPQATPAAAAKPEPPKTPEGPKVAAAPAKPMDDAKTPDTKIAEPAAKPPVQPAAPAEPPKK